MLHLKFQVQTLLGSPTVIILSVLFGVILLSSVGISSTGTDVSICHVLTHHVVISYSFEQQFTWKALIVQFQCWGPEWGYILPSHSPLDH